MENNTVVSQVILDKNGYVCKENTFTIEYLNEKIIATSILKNTKFERQQQSPSLI